MTAELVLRNANLICRDDILHGSIKVADGRIAAIDPGPGEIGLDLDGDFLLPGLIEMHTDNLEKHLVPRPSVVWPAPLAAIIAHDVQIVGAGITTVFDAVAVGEYDHASQRRHILKLAVEAIGQARRHDLLRAEHLVHARCEIADPAVMEMFELCADDPLVRLVSLMDHTPGQRQWRDLARLRTFRRNDHWPEEKIQQFVAERQELQARYADKHRREILRRVNGRKIAIASHDDTTEDHVLEAKADGIRIAEFPTTHEAARAARQHGMHIIMGAPNLVCGGSHSGNVSARDLAAEDLLDGLSSDYAPKSLLHGAFILHDRIGMPLPKAVATVTAHIAAAVGLPDRGELAPGKRADLIRVRRIGDIPVVRSVWREGRQVM